MCTWVKYVVIITICIICTVRMMHDTYMYMYNTYDAVLLKCICAWMLTYTVCVCSHGLLVFILLSYISSRLCVVLSPHSAHIHAWHVMYSGTNRSATSGTFPGKTPWLHLPMCRHVLSCQPPLVCLWYAFKFAACCFCNDYIQLHTIIFIIIF